MRDLDDLLEEAKRRTLTDEEFSYILEGIKNHDPDSDDTEDLYTLIYAFGMADCIQTPGNIYSPARGTKYRKLIEGFLHYPNDPSIACIAMKTLCTYWGYTQDYLDEIKSFIRGVEWDEDRDITLTAISIAGEYLRDLEKKDKRLLQLLIDTWGKEISSVETECVYDALARASGQEWNTLLKSEKPNADILDKVYKMCESL